MKKIDKNEYESIISDIDNSKEFQKTKEIVHHSLNRYDHSKRVSYYSYVVAKKLGLSYEEVARAALLHDFFLVDNKDISVKERMNTLVNHPKYAVRYSEKFFNLTDKEKDIIVSHMFPVCPTRVPKYIESWLVDIIDDAVSIAEEIKVKKGKLINYINIFLAFLITFK